MKIKDTFKDYLAYRKGMGMDLKTMAADTKMLYGSFSHSIAERELSSLTPVDVADLIEAGRSHGVFGPQRSVSTLRKLFRYLDDAGIPTPFDWRDIEVPHVPRRPNEYLTKDELNRVLESFDITKLHGLRTRALCEVLFASGMRIFEALSLDKNDIDWEKKEASVVNAKNGDQQPVFFTDRSLLWLKRYLDARTDQEPYLFTAGKGRMPPVTARFYLRAHTKKLGIKKHIKNHIFRKSFVTHLIEKGADLAMVSDAARHAERIAEPYADQLWGIMQSLGIKKKINHHIFRKTFVTHLLQRKADIMAVKDLARHRSERTTLMNYAGVDKQRSKAIHAKIMNDLLG